MSENKTFKEILKMIDDACDVTFFSGNKDIKDVIVECATKIYIAQMRTKDNDQRTED